MAINYDSHGKAIVSMVVGHLAIPTTKKKYKIVDTIMVTLTKKDFTEFDKIIKAIKSKGHIIHIVNAIMLTKEFPDVLYKKIKKDFPDYFDRADFFVMDMIETFGKDTINVHLDCLEELMHINIKK